MSGIIDQLLKAGILQEDHGFTDETDVVASIEASLRELQTLREKVKGDTSALVKDSTAEDSPTPEAKSVSDSPVNTQSYDIETARALVQAGQIQKNDAGQWESKIAASQGFAESLNQHEFKIERTGREALELLATDKKAFIQQHLAEDLRDLIKEAVSEHTKPLQYKFEQAFRKPTMVDAWFQEHHEELEQDGSKLKQAYGEIFQEMKEQHSHMADRLGDDFEDYIHTLTGPRAEMRVKEVVSSNTNQNQEAAPASSVEAAQEPKPTEKSLIDHVNDGDEVPVEGQRNSGAGRSLNDHGQQIGDFQEPVTNRGRVDFNALASQSAKELGIN